MFWSFIRAILAAVLFGPYLAVLSLLVVILVTVVGTAFGFVISLLMLLGPPGVILVIPLGIILSIGMTALINTQTARYASSITGLRPIPQQRSIQSAFWDCFLLVVIVNLLVVAITAVLITAFLGWENLAALDRENLQLSADAMTGSLWSIMVAAGTVLMVGIYGFFIVPHVCLTERSPPVYGLGWILLRFLIVLPFFVGLTALVAFLVIGGTIALPGISDTQRFWILVPLILLIMLLLNGFLMSFEARFLALVIGKHPVQSTRAVPHQTEARDTDYRALRKEWSERH